MAANPDFSQIFHNLRQILQPHAARLEVTADTPDHYCLTLPYSPKLKKGFPVAWIKISKAYVSYHFMPVYMFPKLRAAASPALQKRMQGKSCFNFKTADPALFAELAQLTATGLNLAKKSGFAPS
jgi:hypothetical protein